MHRDRVSLVSLPASSSIHKLIVMFQLPELQGDDGDYHCSRNYSPKSMSPPAYTRRFRAAQSKYLIVFRRVHKTPQLHCIRILFLSKTILWQCENLRWDRGEMVKVGYSACLRMFVFCMQACERESAGDSSSVREIRSFAHTSTSFTSKSSEFARHGFP